MPSWFIPLLIFLLTSFLTCNMHQMIRPIVLIQPISSKFFFQPFFEQPPSSWWLNTLYPTIVNHFYQQLCSSDIILTGTNFTAIEHNVDNKTLHTSLPLLIQLPQCNILPIQKKALLITIKFLLLHPQIFLLWMILALFIMNLIRIINNTFSLNPSL